MLKFGFKSDKGRVREINQDSCFVMPEEGLFLVADGVGGHMNGELASRTAMTDIASFVRANPIPEGAETSLIKEYFEKLTLLVNEHVYTLAHMQAPRGMATTLLILYISGNKAYAVNVGDSRIYHIRNDNIIQITVDHTFVNDLLRKGIITQEEAERHPDRNMITRAIGADKTVETDFHTFEIEKGDTVILCTDGLYNEVSEAEMLRMVKAESDMRSLCAEFVERANNYGGADNITVVSVGI